MTMEIFTQDEVTTCAISSVVNALGLLGKSPMPIPAFHDHLRSLRERERVSTDTNGATSAEVNYLLSLSGVFAALMHVPPKYWSHPEVLLQRFLGQGCALIVVYRSRLSDGQVSAPHAVVCEGYDKVGYFCIDSARGKRTCVTYRPVATEAKPVGISSEVVIIWRDKGDQNGA